MTYKWFNFTFIKNYFNFRGRATRREFWMAGIVMIFITFVIAGVVVLISPDSVMKTRIIMPAEARIALNIFTVPCYAVAVRRLHDTGRTGWWMLLCLVPVIGAIVLLVYFLEKSEQGENQYGPEVVYAFETTSRQKGKLIE